ncbi:MAG: hypothetical protein WA231_11935, partial [Methylocella sp.]
IKAEDNPWYLLATLYSVSGDNKTINKNRVTWNRYFAANLDAETRTKLIEEKRHPAEELTLLSLEELQEVATAFSERRKASGVELALPDSSADINLAMSNLTKMLPLRDISSADPPLFETQPSPAGPSLTARPSPRKTTLSPRPSPSRPVLCARPSPWRPVL